MRIRILTEMMMKRKLIITAIMKIIMTIIRVLISIHNHNFIIISDTITTKSIITIIFITIIKTNENMKSNENILTKLNSPMTPPPPILLVFKLANYPVSTKWAM